MCANGWMNFNHSLGQEKWLIIIRLFQRLAILMAKSMFQDLPGLLVVYLLCSYLPEVIKMFVTHRLRKGVCWNGVFWRLQNIAFF